MERFAPVLSDNILDDVSGAADFFARELQDDMETILTDSHKKHNRYIVDMSMYKYMNSDDCIDNMCV